MDWRSLFDEAQPAPGASDAEIARFVTSLGQPLTAAEIEAVNRIQQNPFPTNDPLYATYRPFDPSRWVMPSRALPSTYLSFLGWSNGGWFRTGERWFDCFFPTSDPISGVRAMLLGYHLPEYMPGALPIAFNGSGTFYLLDMRLPAVNGEYPVVCAHASDLGWESEVRFVAGSFVAACQGTANVDDLR